MPYENTDLITFEGGLEQYVEPSRLTAGFATELRNWVPEADGSLRLRMKWNEAVETGVTGDRHVRGIHASSIYQPTADDYKDAIVVAKKHTATDYQILAKRIDELDSGSWDLIDTLVSPSSMPFVPFATGIGHIYYTNQGETTVRKHTGVSGTAGVDIANSKGGRALLVYKNRLFSIGNAIEPFKLFYTALGNEDDWTSSSAGSIVIGSDDGDPGNALAELENGILIGKENALHYLVGTNPNNFQLIQLNAGEAVSGNSIVRTPAGAFICGREEVFLFTGSQPQVISRPISRSYVIEGEHNFASAAYVDGKVYIGAHDLEDIFVYDLETEAWHTENHQDVSGRPCALASIRSYLFGGAHNDPDSALVYYRRHPQGDREVDAAGITLRAKTPEMWLGGAEKPFTMKQSFLRLRQRSGDAAQSPLVVKYYLEGRLRDEHEINPEHGAGVFRYDMSWGGTGYFIEIEFEQELKAGEQAAFDIEEIEIVYDAEKRRSGKGGGSALVRV